MKTAIAGIGRSPESRVKWALRFIRRDVARLSAEERDRIWRAVLAWEGRPPLRGFSRPTSDRLPAMQRALREAIEAFANGLPDQVVVPETTMTLFPPPRRAPGRRHSERIQREIGGQRMYAAPVTPALVVLAMVDDLNAIGADRLRACQLETDGRQCGAIFLAKRRQTFCSDKHAQAAAWQRYAPVRKGRAAGILPPSTRRRRR